MSQRSILRRFGFYLLLVAIFFLGIVAADGNFFAKLGDKWLIPDIADSLRDVEGIAATTSLVDDFLRYRGDITFLIVEHMTLVAISGGLAILIAVPLGILLSRPRIRPYADSFMQALNLGSTIPTLAVLALSMSFLGIGVVPSIFGLWIVSLLPIARNTYAGITAVPAHMIEAARGVGMRQRDILWKVELPNALYVIFAGIRTALAINIGTVPLVFLIGGGGLGELIFTGIDLFEPGMMLAGAIPTALLAVITDFVLGQTAFWLIPRGVNPLR